MYILVIVLLCSYFIVLCLFGTRSEPSLWSLEENKKVVHVCNKMDIVPWLSNIYWWRIYLWNVSYASVSGTCSLSVSAALNSKIFHCWYTQFINI